MTRTRCAVLVALVLALSSPAAGLAQYGSGALTLSVTSATTGQGFTATGSGYAGPRPTSASSSPPTRSGWPRVRTNAVRSLHRQPHRPRQRHPRPAHRDRLRSRARQQRPHPHRPHHRGRQAHRRRPARTNRLLGRRVPDPLGRPADRGRVRGRGRGPSELLPAAAGLIARRRAAPAGPGSTPRPSSRQPAVRRLGPDAAFVALAAAVAVVRLVVLASPRAPAGHRRRELAGLRTRPARPRRPFVVHRLPAGRTPPRHRRDQRAGPGVGHGGRRQPHLARSRGSHLRRPAIGGPALAGAGAGHADPGRLRLRRAGGVGRLPPAFRRWARPSCSSGPWTAPCAATAVGRPWSRACCWPSPWPRPTWWRWPRCSPPPPCVAFHLLWLRNPGPGNPGSGRPLGRTVRPGLGGPAHPAPRAPLPPAGRGGDERRRPRPGDVALPWATCPASSGCSIPDVAAIGLALLVAGVAAPLLLLDRRRTRLWIVTSSTILGRSRRHRPGPGTDGSSSCSRRRPPWASGCGSGTSPATMSASSSGPAPSPSAA